MCKGPPGTSLKVILISEFSKVDKEVISITECQMSAYLEHKEMHEFAVRVRCSNCDDSIRYHFLQVWDSFG